MHNYERAQGQEKMALCSPPPLDEVRFRPPENLPPLGGLSREI